MADTDKPNLKKRTSSTANSCADGTVPHFRVIKNKADFLTKIDSDESKFGTGIETDERKIENRTKQILFGKNTIGYDNYISAVPKSSRNRFNQQHPTTPNVHEECSKRQFDGRVRAWRRSLHLWDNVDSIPTMLSSDCATTKKAFVKGSSAKESLSAGEVGISRKKKNPEDAAVVPGGAKAKPSKIPPITAHSQVYNRLAQERSIDKELEDFEEEEDNTQQIPSKRRKVADLAEEEPRLELESSDEFDRRLLEESQRLLSDGICTMIATQVAVMGEYEDAEEEEDDVL